MKTSRAKAEPAFAGGVLARYVESSALIAARLEGDAVARQSILGEGARFTSALTLAEFSRHLVRARVNRQLNDSDGHAAMAWLQQFQRRCEIIKIDDEVLARVKRPFPVEPIRTLDAIHLATIELHEEHPSLVAVVTRDRRIAENARAMGYIIE